MTGQAQAVIIIKIKACIYNLTGLRLDILNDKPKGKMETIVYYKNPETNLTHKTDILPSVPAARRTKSSLRKDGMKEIRVMKYTKAKLGFKHLVEAQK